MKKFAIHKLQRSMQYLLGFSLLPSLSFAAPFTTLDELFTAISQEQPTFAGVYKKANQFVFLTTDGKPLTEVGSLEHLGIDNDTLNQSTVEQAEFSFDLMQETHTLLFESFADLPLTITFTDINEKENHINISASINDPNSTVDIDKARRDLIAFLSSRSGKTLDPTMFNINITKDSGGNSTPPTIPPVVIFPPFLQGIPDLFSPLHQHWGGMNYFNPQRGGRCSWGFTATLKNQRGFVTNSHCVDNNSSLAGNVPQEWMIANFVLASDASTFAQGVVDPLPVSQDASTPSVAENLPAFCASQACRYSDSAFVMFNANYDMPSGFIARPEAMDTSLAIDTKQPTFNITEVGGFTLMGEVVNKVGPSTGWTAGEITESCINQIRPSGVSLICQSISTGSVFSGDSGSPVFTIEPNGVDVRLVGLLHSAFFDAGSDDTNFGFSPITQVFEDLGTISDVTLDTNRPIPSLDRQQIPGYISQDYIRLKNAETRTFQLDILEDGRYTFLLQSASPLDSREVELKLGGQVETVAFNAFNAENNEALVHTAFINAGQHELTITALTTDVILRQIQAVKSDAEGLPVSNALLDATTRDIGNFTPFELPGRNVTGFAHTTIAPQETTELEIEINETGNYQLDLAFMINDGSEEVEISIGDQTIVRALDPTDTNQLLNTASTLSSLQSFKFFDLQQGSATLTIKSNAKHEITLMRSGDANTIK